MHAHLVHRFCRRWLTLLAVVDWVAWWRRSQPLNRHNLTFSFGNRNPRRISVGISGFYRALKAFT